MISILIGSYNIYDVENGSISWDETGDNQVQLTARGNTLDRIFQQNYVSDVIAFDGGREVWRGKLDSVQKTSAGEYTITAYGLLKQLNKIDDYTEFWSSTGTQYALINTDQNTRFNAQGAHVSGELVPAYWSSNPGLFTNSIDNNASFIGLKKGSAIPTYNAGGIMYHTWYFGGSNDIVSMAQARASRLPANFNTYVDLYDTTHPINAVDGASSTNGVPYASVFDLGTNVRYVECMMYSTNALYTVTEEDDYYYVQRSHLRFLADTGDCVTTTLSAGVTPGFKSKFTPASMVGISIGSTVYVTTASGLPVVVSDVDATSFYAQTDYGFSSGATIFVPNLYADHIIDDLVSRVGMRAIYLDAPNVDLPNATFIQQNAGSIIDELRSKAHSSGDLKIIGVADTVYIGNDNLPTYYADVDEYTLEKVVGDKIKSASGSYKTTFGVDRVTGSVSAPVDNGSYRSVAFKSNYTISGAVLNEMSTYLRSMSQVNVKSDFKVSKLYNRAGGIVEYPLPNARVIIRNLLPELYGIADYTYYLRAMTKDLVTGATEYVIGEYIDSVSTLLAGK